MASKSAATASPSVITIPLRALMALPSEAITRAILIFNKEQAMTKIRIAKDGTIDGGWDIADQSINEHYECSSAYKLEEKAKEEFSKMSERYKSISEIRLVNVRYSHVDDSGNVSHSIGQRYAILTPKKK